MGVSVNGGTPKSSILIGFSIINHPFWGTPIFGNTRMTTPTRVLTGTPQTRYDDGMASLLTAGSSTSGSSKAVSKGR